jgi:hypothetical protein
VIKTLLISSILLLSVTPFTMVKTEHVFPSYHTEYEITTNNEKVVDISLHNKTNGFGIDTNFITVQYRSSFRDWYYPIYTTSSDDVYFYTTEYSNQTWHVIIRFKTNVSSHIKLMLYPGAYSETNTWDYWAGRLATIYSSTGLFIKKLIIDAFHGASPS